MRVWGLGFVIAEVKHTAGLGDRDSSRALQSRIATKLDSAPEAEILIKSYCDMGEIHVSSFLPTAKI